MTSDTFLFTTHICLHIDSLIFLLFYPLLPLFGLGLGSLPAQQSNLPLERSPWSSHSKRHASLDSPREVPLPLSSTHQTSIISPLTFHKTASHARSGPPQDAAESRTVSLLPPLPSSQSTSRSTSPNGDEHSSVCQKHGSGDTDSTSYTCVSTPPSPSHQRVLKSTSENLSRQEHHMTSAAMPATSSPSSSDLLPSNDDNSNTNLTVVSGTLLRQHLHLPSQDAMSAAGSTSNSAVILPFSRPYSMPDSQSTALHGLYPVPSPLAPSRTATWPDRNSSASLPLPMQVPFYALPRAGGLLALEESRDPDTLLHAPSAGNSPIPGATAAYSGSASSPGTSALPPRTGPRSYPAPNTFSSSSESSTSSLGSLASGFNSIASSLTSHRSTSPRVPSSPASSPPSTSTPTPYNYSRPISPFRAPQPPPQMLTSRPISSPPVSAPSYPPPELPMILPTDAGHTTRSTSRQQPHEPFLSHAPPPADSWIEVETTQGEYRLNVRLPGFTRDGITLATKRRRILHVVADRWENGGGKWLCLFSPPRFPLLLCHDLVCSCMRHIKKAGRDIAHVKAWQRFERKRVR